MKRRLKKNKKLVLEKLEDRHVLAGNVVSELVGDELTLRGDNLDNSIVIEEIAIKKNNQEAEIKRFRIRGLQGTTFNGGSNRLLFDKAKVKNLKVFMADGNDRFVVDNISIAKDIRVKTGAGNDTVAILDNSNIGNSLIVGSLAGNDKVTVSNSLMGGALNIASGIGRDSIELFNTIVSTLRLSVGNGTDTVKVTEVKSKGLASIQGAAGADIISIDDSSLGNMRTNLRGGNDQITMNNVQLKSDLQMSLGSGKDRVLVQNSKFDGDFRTQLQAGGDIGWFVDSIIKGTYFVDGGDGGDALESKNVSARKKVFRSLFETPIYFVDQLFDAIEQRLAIAGVVGDVDNDRIPSSAEAWVYGTDPALFDTDGDLLSDRFETSANGLNPKVPDNINGDLDGDNLTNLEEQQFGTRPDVRDSDGDGTDDGTEARQGSDPNDASDKGEAPDENDIIRLQLTIGDHSGSHSERYELRVGPISHQAPQFGVVNTKEYVFMRGRSYDISIFHRGTNLSTPDYDYTAKISYPAGEDRPALLSDPNRIMGVHDESSYFFAAGKKAKLYIPKLVITTDKPKYEISPDPKMPTVKAKVKIAGLDQRFTNLTTFNWFTRIKYDSSTAKPSPRKRFITFHTVPGKNLKGSQPYVPVFTKIRGGDMTFTVKASVLGITLEETSKPIKIVPGEPPTAAAIRKYIFSTKSVYNETLFKIARHESKLKQFNGSHPLWSSSRDGGVGLFQITNPEPTPDDIWNWKANVDRGRKIFSSKLGTAGRYAGIVQKSPEFEALVEKFNDSRVANGKTRVEVKVPKFTQQQLIYDAVRGFNGFAGKKGEFSFYYKPKDKRLYPLHEYTLKMRKNGQLFVNSKFEAEWERICYEDREQTMGEKDYVNKVFGLSGDETGCSAN